jgi:ribonuclease J
MAALTRISKDEYRLFQIKKGDTVIISALPIPGNEKSVYATIDNLGRKGIDVIYEEASKMHVSGHAYQEELKVLATLLRPKCFIPIHGEFRHLKAHTELVKDLGLTPHIMIAENGDVIGISKKNGLQKVDRVPVRLFYLDSNDAWLEDDQLIGERQQMAHDGVVVVDFRENEVRVDSRGVSPDPEDFMKGLRDSIIDQYRYALQERRMSKDELHSELEQIVRKYMIKKTGKSPAVIVLISGR